jgi:endo-1,4-beta-mannosidase
MQPFVLGVNYWPRTKAMYWWRDFDAREVAQDFALIASLGMTVVRIFLLWDDWQPSPDSVSADCLNNLRTVCDLAAQHRLKLNITFFTGHMSGPNWAPTWLLDDAATYPSPHVRQLVSGAQVVARSYRNPFSDPVAREAARLLLCTVVDALKTHPAIWLWNLGNEPDLFAWPESAAAGRAWVREMTQLIKTLDPQHPVTCGLHVASLLEDNHLRVPDVFAETDVAVMHAYPMYLPIAREPLDPDLVPFSCALVTALCGKPTLMEEWGGCTTTPGKPSEVWEWVAYGQLRRQFMASEDDLAAYVTAVLPKLLQVGASGALLWCFADYHEALWDKPPCDEARHERFFGLVRPDGSLKPHAEALRAFAATHPTVQPANYALPADAAVDYYARPAERFAELYQAYLKQYDLQQVSNA